MRLKHYGIGVVLGLAVVCAVVVLVERADAQERRRLFPRNQPAATAPQVVEGPIRDKIREARERIALRLIKNKVIERATTVGVEGKKLTRAEAEAAYERMEKDLGSDGIMAVAADASPQISGKIAGGPLTDFLDWLLKNAPAIIELIMKILPLFLV